MLSLKRKRGETIVVNGDIVITFLGMRGDRATIGINAPKEVQILRGELIGRTPSSKQDSPGVINPDEGGDAA